jgi:pyridoxal phosphate enzyme (YggS family)
MRNQVSMINGAASAAPIGAIAENVARVRELIAAAARKAGRAPEEIRLVAVSKKMPVERIREAIAAGVTELGENYLQEAAAKIAEIGHEVSWHYIGHLQTNKAKAAVPLFDMVQTIDRLRLAEELSRRAAAMDRRVPVLVQVNTSGEESKAGCAPAELRSLLAALAPLPGIAVEGLMSIGRWVEDPEAGRPEFRLLAGLFREATQAGLAGIEMRWLSMGMSHDYEVAIEEGANLVRVGTALFGPR